MTVLDAWESYVRDVMPPNAGQTQRVETRRAFYGGAWVMLNLLKKIADEQPDVQAEASMDALYNELCRFHKDVGEGKA
jgi:hypothetical protein